MGYLPRSDRLYGAEAKHMPRQIQDAEGVARRAEARAGLERKVSERTTVLSLKLPGTANRLGEA
jgi:hypothetical protein